MQHDNKALTRRWFEEVWNARRRDAADELASPGAVTWGLVSGDRPAGFPEFLEMYGRFLSAFPDLHMEIGDVIGEGDQTVARLRARGTHTGEGLGVPPTGRPVTFSAMVWIRWQDGRVVEAWNEFDALGMMQQVSESPRVKIKA